MFPNRLPDVVFHTRVRNPSLGGDNPFEWKDVTTADLFAGKRVVLFGLPGAFTPACSDSHLPAFERSYEEFQSLGVHAVICTSVNDAFVMFQWAKARDIHKVFMLPDGNGDFARRMGLLVERKAQGMGMRSWRYCLYAEDAVVKQIFAEPDMRDNPSGVGLTVSDAGTMLNWLRARQPSSPGLLSGP